MTDCEIEAYKQKLKDILADGSQNDEKRKERRESLEKLAQEVGASITRLGTVVTERGGSQNKKFYNTENVITETEIVHNIQVVLQTATMINMCKTSTKNYKVAIVAAITAVLSALAAWVAVCIS